MPKRRKIHFEDSGHADEHDLSPGPHDREALLQRVRAADAVNDEIDSAGEALDLPIVGLEGERTRQTPRGPSLFFRRHDLIRAEIPSEPPLFGMLRDGDERARKAQ